MMKTLWLVLLSMLLAVAIATRGSISNHLDDDDADPDDFSDEDVADVGLSLSEARKKNPCFRKKCHRGESCMVDDKRQAKCVCTPAEDCDYYLGKGERYKTCSNKNVTYETECHLDRDHCLCKRKKDGCSSPGVRKIQLEYFGPCKEFSECTSDEEGQFPSRIRDWFFIVMQEIAQRTSLGEYEQMLTEAENTENHEQAVIWKYCDLDVDPQDRFVSRRELQWTVRTLRAMEHCLMPFLDDCDANSDRKITLWEWGRCLKLDDDHIIDKCSELHKPSRRK